MNITPLKIIAFGRDCFYKLWEAKKALAKDAALVARWLLASCDVISVEDLGWFGMQF